MTSHEQVDPRILLQDVHELPSFVNCRSEYLNFFDVEASGDDQLDIKRGDALAEEALSHARQYRTCACIGFALAAIAERGAVGALEGAFIARISAAALHGASN